jgi:uncharacterized protein YjiS (DUF1127 family)
VSQVTTQTFPAHGSAMRRVLGTMIVNVKQRFARNATERKLRSLDNRTLKDIGVSRSEITRAAIQSSQAIHL